MVETRVQLVAALKSEGIYQEARHSEQFVRRFLRARAYRLEDALAMLRAYEKWRVDENVDDLLHYELSQELREKLHALYPRFYHGVDKFGRPVYIEVLKKFELKKLEALLTEDELHKLFISSYEQLINLKLPACCRASGNVITECLTILDLDGLSILDVPSLVRLIRKIAAINSNYYPETLFRMIVINASFLIKGLWPMARGYIDPKTVAKTKFFSGSAKELLLELVDADNLPKRYGGTCDCPGGCDKSNKGPWNSQASG